MVPEVSMTHAAMADTFAPPIDVVSKKLLHTLGVEAETKAYAEIALQQAEKLLAAIGDQPDDTPAKRSGEPTFTTEDLRATIAYWNQQLATRQPS